MQSVSSRIWTRVAVSISDDANHYTKSSYYVNFQTNALGKGINLLILPAIGWIVPHKLFCKVYFGIQYPSKIEMPLNRETEPNQLSLVQIEGCTIMIKLLSCYNIQFWTKAFGKDLNPFIP